jgi:hypothetical protein
MFCSKKIIDSLDSVNFLQKCTCLLQKISAGLYLFLKILLNMNLTNLTIEQKMQGMILLVICCVAVIRYVIL